MSVVRSTVSWGRVSRFVTAGALATALVACSGGSSGSSSASSSSGGSGGGSVLTGDPKVVVASAPGKSSEAKNANVSLTGSIASSGQTVPLTGTGAIDFQNKAFNLNLTLPGMGSVEELLVGQIIYVKVPSQEAAEFGGKPWLKIDPSQFGGGQNPFGSLDSSNPTQILNTLQGVGTVTKIGDEDVRGTHTVHYRADVDIAKAADAQKLTPEQKQQLQTALGGKSTIPEDVWVDDQGLVRRIGVDISGNAPTGSTGSGTALKAQLKMEFFDYGKATVNTTPPPADQITDFGQILGQLGQLGGAFGSSSSGTSS